MTQSTQRAINVVGMVALIGLAAVLLLWLWLLILWANRGILSPLALDAYGSERAGIELFVIPVAAIAGVLARHRIEWFASLHTRRVGPYLPLFTAAVLLGLALYWVWIYELPDNEELRGVLRVSGAVISASVMFVGISLYPRVFATLAGALGATAVSAGVVFLSSLIFGSAAVEQALVYSVYSGHSDEYTLFGWPLTVGLTLGLLAASLALRVRNPNPPLWTPRAWTSATLPAICPPVLIAASAAWSAGLTFFFVYAGIFGE